MQTQADIIQISLHRPAMRETTALGAAFAAGYALNLWQDFDEMRNTNQASRVIFKPQLDQKASKKMFLKWEQAVQMSRGWDKIIDDK